MTDGGGERPVQNWLFDLEVPRCLSDSTSYNWTVRVSLCYLV
jgi:hypothetical protein